VEGVVILKVAPGSAAEKAGLKGATVSRDGGIIPGDTIVAIEGKPVEAVGKLLSRLDDFKVGQTIKVTVLRDDKRVEVPVTLQPGV
jgi:S1-C subfamily serine protease